MMRYVAGYTLQRAWYALTDDEFFWEPVIDSRGVRLPSAVSLRGKAVESLLRPVSVYTARASAIRRR
jgi:hypothetical protein